jgi:ATP-dependent RNA helicase DeaD
MPQPIKKLAERILVNPEFISITKGETTNKDIAQQYYVIDENERDDAIIRLLDAQETHKVVVFCRTKKEVDRLSNVLSAVGYNAKGLHGDMEQRQRESVIRGLKSAGVDILVATDVAARGIHIDDVSHVINYHIPFDPESYVHRIGRTGRAGQKGMAITLVTPIEFKELQRIKSKVGTTMEHAFIPSKLDVKKAGLDRLVESIEHQKIYDEAHLILDALKNDIDMEKIIYKLTSMLLDNQKIQGPNNIGIAPERLEKIMQGLNQKSGSGDKKRSYGRNRSQSASRNRNGSGSRHSNRSGGSSRRPRD